MSSNAEGHGRDAIESEGKVLLTADTSPENTEDLHGKIVVSQGGCLGFIPVPGGGKPRPLLVPEGSKLDMRSGVTIGDSTYDLGQIVDLEGLISEKSDAISPEFADRCGSTEAAWIAQK